MCIFAEHANKLGTWSVRIVVYLATLMCNNSDYIENIELLEFSEDQAETKLYN